jgi:hypothetical protein
MRRSLVQQAFALRAMNIGRRVVRGVGFAFLGSRSHLFFQANDL